MCGRFTLEGPGDQLKDFFEVDEALHSIDDRYNIAPTQDVLVIQRDDQGKRVWAEKTWGLVPAWSKDRSRQAKTINARLETVTEKPSFRVPFRNRRCIVPATGYYEWVRVDSKKIPHYIHPTNTAALAFAGLWDRWVSDAGEVTESCTILTRSATLDIEHIHHRMPVLLEQAFLRRWLDPSVTIDPKEVLSQGHPTLKIVPVSDRVNSVRNDGIECTLPRADGDPEGGQGSQLSLII